MSMKSILRTFCLSVLFSGTAIQLNAQIQIPGKPYLENTNKVAPKNSLAPKNEITVGSNRQDLLKTLPAFKADKEPRGYYPLPQTSALGKAGMQTNQKIALALNEVKEEIALRQVTESIVLK